MSLTEYTRRQIVDYLTLSPYHWSGAVSESEFLSRIYNLAEMPSTDRRLPNAARDIQQHRDNWQDWSNDWVFFDTRFNLMHGTDEDFLRFLCETIHPVVRPNPEHVSELLELYNRYISVDGWEIYQREVMSERPIYSNRRTAERVEVFVPETGWPLVDRQMSEVRQSLHAAGNTEQFQTVGLLCREALTTLAQTVYNPETHPIADVTEVSPTDFKRQIEAYLNVELGGGPNEEARRHAKASLSLANALTHTRTADFRMAALCAEAAASVVNIVMILEGRRERI